MNLNKFFYKFDQTLKKVVIDNSKTDLFRTKEARMYVHGTMFLACLAACVRHTNEETKRATNIIGHSESADMMMMVSTV